MLFPGERLYRTDILVETLPDEFFYVMAFHILEDVVSSSSLAPKTLVPVSNESCIQPTPSASLQERPGNRSFNQQDSSKYLQPKFIHLVDYWKSVRGPKFSEETFSLTSTSWRTRTS